MPTDLRSYDLEDDMTPWESFVQNLNLLAAVDRPRICLGFFIDRLSEKELNCVSQLLPSAEEIGIIARSNAELERGTEAIQRVACTDARWGIVHMVVLSDKDAVVGRWHIFMDCWIEGRY